MTPQEKAKAAFECLRTVEFGSEDDIKDTNYALELIGPIANGTHVIVPVEPTQSQRNHVDNLVSIFIADDDYWRDSCNDLIIRSYRAMVRAMINEVE